MTSEERKEIRKEAKLWLDKYLTKHGIKKEKLEHFQKTLQDYKKVKEENYDN